MADLMIIVAGFLLVALIVTYLFKRYNIGQTYYIITLVKTKKFLPLLDKYSKLPWLDKFADFGLLIGFGAFAADYLWGSKQKSKLKRGLYFIVSFLLLSTFFYILFNPMVSGNPLTKDYIYLFSASFGLMGFAGWVLVALLLQGVDILVKLSAGQKACPGVAPIIPGLDIPQLPITVPLHAWISLLIILLLHEGMHGVLARKAKVKIKSAGLLLLGFLPIGAFVEPEEKEVAKRPKREVARIYSAGPTANFLTFIIVSLLLSLATIGLLVPFAVPQLNELRHQATEALVIEKVDEQTEFCGDVFPNSAHGILEAGDEILAVNGLPVEILADYVTESAKDAEKVTLQYKKASGLIRESTFEKNAMGLIGITLREEQKPGFEYTWEQLVFMYGLGALLSFFTWFVLLNFLVSAINFLPTNPFDGGKLALIIFTPLLAFTGWSEAKREKAIGKFFMAIILLLFVLNALPLFI